MGSPVTPMHGKYAALYVFRPNGFEGIGLNDVTWGTGSTAADLTIYEVVIDSELGGGGGVDTFKWRVNGGAWTTDVDITGAAQVLADAQTVLFAATTGHTLDDSWTIGNLKDEPTTENAATAQITDATARILNPNAPPTWTDDGGKTVLTVNYTNGYAVFTANVGNVTVTGNNGFVPTSALKKVGYLIDWTLNPSLDMADTSAQGDNWKTAIPAMGGGSGSANAYFIANESLFRCLEDSIGGGDKYWFLQLLNYDPSENQTGDYTSVWATFTSFAIGDTFGSVVKETVNFQIEGSISFTAAA